MSTVEPDPEARFRATYDSTCADVLRFAQRRAHPNHAEDVAAEAFVVAWRRISEVPSRPEEARAWLFGVARHCLMNSARGRGRQEALAVRLAGTTTHGGLVGGEDADLVAQRVRSSPTTSPSPTAPSSTTPDPPSPSDRGGRGPRVSPQAVPDTEGCG